MLLARTRVPETEAAREEAAVTGALPDPV